MATSAPTTPGNATDDTLSATPPAGVHSLWRLRGYLRPYRTSLLVMAVAAVAGVGLTIAIPLVTKALIDGPIAHHELGPVLPLGLLALALGVAEAALIWVRRWTQSNAVLSLETDLRHDLYEHLQRLPMSFHARWQSGQLLSRVTTDLSQIRRFSGFGLLFLVINLLQVVVVTGVLLAMYWPLGLVVAFTAVPIVVLSMRFEKRYVVVSRRVQDQQGDLATRAEEGAVGIRVIKAFGRSEHVSRQYEEAARTLHATSMDKVALSARFWTFLEVIPNLAVVLVLLLGALGVGEGWLTPGELVAFITLLLSLVWPVASLGRDPGDDPGGDDRGRPGAGDLRHRARHRPRRPDAWRRRAGTCASSTSTSPSPTPRRSPCCATSTSTSHRARRSRWWARPDPARPPSPPWCPGSTT